MDEINLITVTGPTASGKTAFAAQLAARINGEIISADSRQVYRGMDLGTGKDYAEYFVEGNAIPYHLIDIKPAGYKYNVYEFQNDFFDAYNRIRSSGKMPLLVGGTGLYIEAATGNYKLQAVPANNSLRTELGQKPHEELVTMLKSLKPDLHNTTDLTSKKRTIRAIEIAQYDVNLMAVKTEGPIIHQLVIGMNIDRDTRRNLISARLKARLDNGMIEEVAMLLATVPAEDLLFYGLEYKYLTLFVIGQLTYEEMFMRLETAIHQFAKRQMTWFRKMERDGIKIHWIDAGMSMQDKLVQARAILKLHDIVLPM